MGTKQTTPNFDKSEFMSRAFAAYYQGARKENPPIEPAQGKSTLETVRGRSYVVLRNTHGTLAVYRIRNQGILKRLRRWPKEIDAPPTRKRKV